MFMVRGKQVEWLNNNHRVEVKWVKRCWMGGWLVSGKGDEGDLWKKEMNECKVQC